MSTAKAIAQRLLEDELDDLRDDIGQLPSRACFIKRYDVFISHDEDNPDGEPYDKNEHEPVEIFVDEYDEEDGRTLADVAVAHLTSEGAAHASSSHFHTGVWYLSDSRLMNDGTYEESTWHLKGFTPEEEAQIFKDITGR